MVHLILLATVLVATALPDSASAAPLSLSSAVELAVQRSETARSARAGVASAAEAARAAAQLPDPMLRVSMENLPSPAPTASARHANSMTMKRFGISQEWLSGDKRDARRAAAEAAVGKESVQERIAAADARLQTALAYIDAFYVGEALQLTTLMEHHAHEQLETARARCRIGERQQRGGARARRCARHGRGRVRGAAPAAERRARRAPALDRNARRRARRADRLSVPKRGRLRQCRSDGGRAAARGRGRAHGGGGRRRSNRRPNWTWEVAYGQRTGYSDMISFGVSIPLPVAPAARQDRETASKLALVDKAEAELTEAIRAARRRIPALVSDMQRLQERIERVRSGVLDSRAAAHRRGDRGLPLEPGEPGDALRCTARRGRRAAQAPRRSTRARETAGATRVPADPDGRHTMKPHSTHRLQSPRQRSCVGAGFWLGRTSRPSTPRRASRPRRRAAASADSRKVLYWHDPMVPGQRFDKPGKSPFMDMPLVPVYADGDAPGGVQVSPSVQQSLGIRTATVRRATMSSSFDAVGTVQFDERRNVAVQTRVAGYVERLAVRAPMERVRKGQTLATLFAPDWLAPQNELLALKSAGVAADLVAAARDRLRALSIPEELVQRSEQSGTAQARFALASPADGVVAELARSRRRRREPRDDAVSDRRPRDRLGSRRGSGGASRATGARPEGQGDAPGRSIADVRGRAEGDPSRGQQRDAHAQGEVRGRQPGRQAGARNAAAPGGRRAAGRSPGRAVGSGHPYRQARGRDPAQRRRSLRAARGRLGADFGDDVEIARASPRATRWSRADSS